MLDAAEAAPKTDAPAPLSAAVRCETPGSWLQLLTINSFEWNQIDVPIPGLSLELDGLRLLHLSDFHARARWETAYDKLIERVRKDPPDLILFTGDFVESKYDPRPALGNITRLVSELSARLGFVGILGNHDLDLIGPTVSAIKNATLIDNRRLCLSSGSATIELIGLGGIEREDIDMQFLQSLEPKAENSVRIVLSHFPDVIRRVTFLKPDLFLCGHTHGGQVCLPGRLPLIRHDSLPRRLCSGIHREFDTWMVINRGIGFCAAGLIRLFCPSEVIEIRLRRA